MLLVLAGGCGGSSSDGGGSDAGTTSTAGSGGTDGGSSDGGGSADTGGGSTGSGGSDTGASTSASSTGGTSTGGTTCDYPEPAEDYVKEPFVDDFDGAAVDETTWQIATWSEHNGQTGTERVSVENGHLTMVLVNDASLGVLSSAIQTRQEFFYGRWEARLKPSSVPNVLNSLYTIDWDDTSTPGATDDGTKQEIDIELLTKSFTGSNGSVHFALHADGLPSSDTNPDIELGFDPSADFHVYGFDITPEGIEWFVDDQVLWSIKYDENPITIDAPYMLKLNFWTGGDWVLGPPPPGVEAIYLIDWIRFTPCLNSP